MELNKHSRFKLKDNSHLTDNPQHFQHFFSLVRMCLVYVLHIEFYASFVRKLMKKAS
jgi:hypothetical protein